MGSRRTRIEENSPEAGLEGCIYLCEGECGGADGGVVVVKRDIEEAARNCSVVDD